MSYKATGTITAISEILTFDSGAKKLSFQIDTNEQYNNIFSFDLFKSGEHVKFVDNFPTYNKVGDIVEVEFNINCKEYNGKFYTNLGAWKVDKVGGSTQSTTEESTDDLAF